MAARRIRSHLLIALAAFAITAARIPVADAQGGRKAAAVGAIAVAAPTPTATPAERPLRLRVPVSPPDHSFHQVATALTEAARANSAAGGLFQFDAELGDYAGDARAQREISDYVANARFALPEDSRKYVDAQWMLPDLSPGAPPDRGAWIREDAFASIVAEGAPDAARSEPARMHPGVRGWKIDREEIVRAVAVRPELFREGLASVTVTSAIRARTPEKVFGLTGAGKSAALNALPADHAVVAIVSVSHPCDIIHPGEYWTGYLCGNYLVIDGADRRELAAGAYHEFHQED